MKLFFNSVASLAAGAAVMYYLDPEMGRRRRAHASDPPIPDQPTIPDAPNPGAPGDVPDIGTPEPEPDQQPGTTGD